MASNRSRRSMKKPDMGSLSGVPTSSVGEPRRQSARYPRHALPKSRRAAAFDIARARHQIGLAASAPRQHFGKHFFVMLQIGASITAT